MVEHTFNPIAQEIEANGSLSLRTARTTQRVCPEKQKENNKNHQTEEKDIFQSLDFYVGRLFLLEI